MPDYLKQRLNTGMAIQLYSSFQTIAPQQMHGHSDNTENLWGTHQ
ncbi:hypothetical protein [Leptothermofonsia sichuanensis]|nr:hypothetical protein [Leptothermofonsia sichuanensis]